MADDDSPRVRLLLYRTPLHRRLRAPVSPSYDSGSVEGDVIKDDLRIDGITLGAVEMGVVRHQPQRIRGFRADGVVGLAFPALSSTHQTSPSRYSTFVQLLQEQFGDAGRVFSVYLTRE